ncbi:hypothetical protein CISG_05197 [Coccidioides immitis RMSCC 3703]|uniref:Major facilitator superfamily (MFS) profile domain-containing protein n=1 Tax=Coccidioides immitis RMSCC 3703 TaxID=454286 RepID=A0A0J8QUP3_COCIT|nr:hypothetical protein CISG_05197 [Coccidioides immitis RMSCC 3703]
MLSLFRDGVYKELNQVLRACLSKTFGPMSRLIRDGFAINQRGHALSLSDLRCVRAGFAGPFFSLDFALLSDPSQPRSVEDSRADGSSGSTVNPIDPTNEKPAETAEPGAALQNSDEESDKKIDPGKEKASVNNVSSVPNGGTRAWLQVLGAHFLFFNSWGIVNTFGSYETYYEIDLLSTSSPSSIAWYFTTKLATAVGFTASGSSFGGIIYPIVFHRLQPKIGFPWATRVLGFIMLSTQLVSIVVMRVRVVPDKKRAILDLAAFKELPYFFFVFSVFVGFMGLYQPFFYVQTFAIQNSITNSNLGFYILAIMNSTSAFGRIIPGILSDKIKNAAGLIVLMALYGFFSGTFVSSPTSIVVHLSTHSRGKIGTRLGQCFGVVSFGLLIGTPVGGVVYKQHGFSSLWILAGVLIAASGAILLTSRKFYKGLSLMIKA